MCLSTTEQLVTFASFVAIKQLVSFASFVAIKQLVILVPFVAALSCPSRPGT
jgi:hypothetical protein